MGQSGRLKTGTLRSFRLTAIALILLFALAEGADAAKEDATFTLSRLSVADRVLSLFSEDLNADGLKDIVIIHRKGLVPHETRWISIFWQYKSGTFAAAADQSWEIDTAAAVIDVGDVTGDAKLEIVYITPKDVRYYSIVGGSFATRGSILFAAGALAAVSAKENIPYNNFVRDWNDDGQDEVGVFMSGGFAVFMRGTDGVFSSRDVLPMEQRTRMMSEDSHREPDVTAALGFWEVFPELRFVGFDGDRRRDIVASTEDRVLIYPQDQHGAFSRERVNTMDFDLRTQKEKIENTATLHTTVADVRGDGYSDAFVTKQIAKGLMSFRTVISIFKGGPGGYKKDPAQVIVSEGSVSDRSLIRDVNGDGRLDLILPSVKLSIMGIIRMLMVKSIPISFNIFLLQENGNYSERPDFTKEVTLNIDFSGDSDSQAMDLDGDYNGDKRNDFVFATDTNELSIYLGIKDGGKELFSKKPAAKVKANAFGELMSPDLNGDGFSDILLYYPGSKDRWGTIEVLINLKKIR